MIKVSCDIYPRIFSHICVKKPLPWRTSNRSAKREFANCHEKYTHAHCCHYQNGNKQTKFWAKVSLFAFYHTVREYKTFLTFILKHPLLSIEWQDNAPARCHLSWVSTKCQLCLFFYSAPSFVLRKLLVYYIFLTDNLFLKSYLYNICLKTWVLFLLNVFFFNVCNRLSEDLTLQLGFDKYIW